MDKPNLSAVFLGHIDSGKSTTVGHLMYQVGAISERELNNLKQTAAELGKGSFCYAFINDTTRSERERGITIEGNYRNIIGANYNYTLIDAPGHRNFLKNAITCISQADAAVLVVAAAAGEFEIGMSRIDGKIREHCLLAYTFGIRRLVVVVNKMDSVGYNSARFEEIVAEIRAMLKKIPWPSSDKVSIVPVSSWHGENLTTRSANMPWYYGPTLQEALEALSPVSRPTEKPFRMPVNDIYRISGVGHVVVGTVASGRITKESNLTFCPSNVNSDVQNLERFHSAKELAEAGDFIGIALENKAISVLDIRRGHVAGTSDNPPVEVERFVGQIIVLQIPNWIRNGFSPIIDIGTAHIECKMKLLQKINRATGEVVAEETIKLKSGEAAMVEFTPLKPLCVERYVDIPALGRFTMRDHNTVIGVGVVKSVDRKIIGGKLTKSAMRSVR